MSASLQGVVRRMRQVTATGTDAPDDAELLARYVDAGEAAAFELLVWRHGGMVLGVCRRILRAEADAEDAFQATFLALARKAGTLSRRAAVSGWLYRVAFRVAIAARRRTEQWCARQRPMPDVPGAAPAPAECDLGSVLDEELGRLPERYRVSVVLCYLEGRTLAEAAVLLGRPRGTIGTWLARARQRLRKRLAQRGLAPAAALTATLTVTSAPAALADRTVRLVTGATAVPPAVATITEEALRTMFLTQIKFVAAAALIIVVLGAGGIALHSQAADPPAAASTPAATVAFPNWGQVIDPDRDCKFTFAKGALTIDLPGSDHALCVERGKMNAPRVLQPVDGDFIMQAKVSAKMPQGAASLVPSRRPFHGAGLVLFQDDDNYVRLEKATFVSNGDNHRYVSWELRSAGKFERVGNSGELPLDDDEVYLRLERRDGKLFALVSTDGLRWTSLEPIESPLAKKALVGVVAGHNTSSGFAPQFSELKLFRDAAGK